MEKKKYNLHSFKSDGVQAPIQMHLSEDHHFLANLLGSDDAATQQRPFDRLATKVPILLLTNTRPLMLKLLLIKLFCSNCLPLANA